MKILYFAWIRSKIGVAEESVSPPPEVVDVTSLLDWLKQRGPNYADAFANLSVVKAAVNQDYVDFDRTIGANDEIAFFPPVTGG